MKKILHCTNKMRYINKDRIRKKIVYQKGYKKESSLYIDIDLCARC